MTKTISDAIYTAEITRKKNDIISAISGLVGQEKDIIWHALNPFRVYNVRKYDRPTAFANSDPAYSERFIPLLDQLDGRVITGNAARAAVTAVLGTFTERTAAILARVLNKDFKCGANRDTFESVYRDLCIPSFELMLAGKIEEASIATKHNPTILTAQILRDKYGMTFPLQAEAKYDGRRAVCIVKDGEVTYLSRSGLQQDFMTGVFDDELAQLERTAGKPIVVDGEVLSDLGFQATSKSIGFTSDRTALKFYAFDVMSLEDWNAKDCKYHQGTRSKYLSTLLDRNPQFRVVTRSKWKVCQNISELIAFHHECIADGQQPDGSLNGRGEGLIVKRLDGLYIWGRSEATKSGKGAKSTIIKGFEWVKWKPVLDLDLKIVGFEYGQGRLSATVGKLLLEGYDENGTFVKASCGSGLNDKIRADMIANWSNYLGKIAMIECQELSLAQGSTTYSARFPIFCKMRADKS